MQDAICGHPKALAMRSMNSFLEQVTIPRACIALKMAMKDSKTSSVTTCRSSFFVLDVYSRKESVKSR